MNQIQTMTNARLTRNNSTKNQRRRAQEAALRNRLGNGGRRQQAGGFRVPMLRKTIVRQRGASTALTGGPRRSMVDPVTHHTVGWYSKLARGELAMEHLPYVGADKPEPYSTIRVSYLLTPDITDSSNTTWVVCNPMMAWTDNVIVPANTNLQDLAAMPTVYATQNNTLENGTPFVASGAYPTAVTDLFPADHASGFSGRVQFMGGTFQVENFTTQLNQGGQFIVAHNPGHRSFTWLDSGAGGVVTIRYADATQVESNQRDTSRFELRPGGMHGAILPPLLGFTRVTSTAVENFTDIGSNDAYLAGRLAGPDGVYIPDTSGEEAALGWNFALGIRPAETIAAGTSSKRLVRFQFVYRVNLAPLLHSNDDSKYLPRAVGQNPTSVATAHPNATAASHNIIARVKQLRQTVPNTVAREGLSWNGLEKTFEKGGVLGAGMYLGQNAWNALRGGVSGIESTLEAGVGPTVEVIEDALPMLTL